MSPSEINHLPIEYISLDKAIPLAVLLWGLCVQVLRIIFDLDAKVYSFFLGSDHSSIPMKETTQSNRCGTCEHEKKSREDCLPVPEKKTKPDDRVCRGDVEVVFRSLGMLSNPPQEPEQMIRFQENDVFDLFEEKEPSEYEVRAAFEVFDENKDGFIDARELQRILSALGLTEGSDMENCRRMIRAVDENGDGRIDFHEFVKFMETVCY
ncbi:OLC1v1009594C1 [Oldenlandia corymbosa var. corymbosa]|uniref:OLC1v1009594C1 n=1 Tax=Oldenlandia corymbosa var. corymbosa TaxID=529605 RepID=A0AAV1DS00_OLDCO|nr:OLC1v1009594C1 [Oldenlandia corymbosa var. corymbosa]